MVKEWRTYGKTLLFAQKTPNGHAKGFCRFAATSCWRFDMRRPNGTFLPGHSSGRPKGARNRLQSSFLYALAEDFEKHGADAIKICRIEEPARYVQIVASLMPRELEIEHQTATSDLDDEQLDNLITQIRQQLLTKSETQPMKMIEPKFDKVLIERKTNGQQ